MTRGIGGYGGAVQRHALGFRHATLPSELKHLGGALDHPARPFVAVLGGAKVSGKLEVIENLLGKVDALIERYGTVERFGESRSKYFYFEERKYWHLGEPHSEDPEKWPNVINRTWVDVRRHAANVKHKWGPEELELQMRLWEMQLEKKTDGPKSKTPL